MACVIPEVVEIGIRNLRRLAGVNAEAEVDAGMTPRDVMGARDDGRRVGDLDEVRHAGVERALEHRLTIFVEAFVGEMAMRVDHAGPAS